MKLLALAGTLGFVLTGAVIGVRLLLLARHTRQQPELFVGSGLFLFAGVAQPLLVSSQPLAAAIGDGVYIPITGLGLAAMLGTFAGMYFFTWLVFRSDSGIARVCVVLALVAAAGTIATLLWSLAQQRPGTPNTLLTRGCLAALALNFSAAMAWTAVESLRYYGLVKRRLALGLADPVVVNRFLVWGIGCATCGLTALAIMGFAAAGVKVVVHPAPILLVATTGILVAACWYLSFLPPAAYRRWIGRDAVAEVA